MGFKPVCADALGAEPMPAMSLNADDDPPMSSLGTLVFHIFSTVLKLLILDEDADLIL
jgi:hypothetical protein